MEKILLKIYAGIKRYGLSEVPFSFYKLIVGINLFPTKKYRAYWHVSSKVKNFGDMVTPYIIKKQTGQKPRFANEFSIREFVLGAGSVLEKSSSKAIIWGTGLMNIDHVIKQPKKVLAVRGPITRKRLIDSGIDCPEIYGDPGILLPLFYTPKATKTKKIGIIPHYTDNNMFKQLSDKDFLIIDLLEPIEEVIEKINSCEKTISSSLHGVIVSHAYGIPSIWVNFGGIEHKKQVKFSDYFGSLEIEDYDSFVLDPEKLNIVEITKLFEENKNIILPEKGILQKRQNKLLDVNPFL